MSTATFSPIVPEMKMNGMSPLELVQLATKIRFGLHPPALEIEPSAFQLELDQLGVGFAVFRKQYPERFSHVAPTAYSPVGLIASIPDSRRSACRGYPVFTGPG